MSEIQKTERIILEALARGYTYVANESKELDIKLMEAMAEEIMIVLDKELPKTVILAYKSFPKEKSTVADLLDELLKEK